MPKRTSPETFSPDSLPAPTECPYYLITRASLATTQDLKAALTMAGVGTIRPAYLGVLLSLWREDGLRSVDLGRRAGLEPSTMTGLLDRMERDGLVVRQRDPKDRRAHRIELTEEAKTQHLPVLKVVASTLDRAFAGVSREDMEATSRALRQVLANCNRLEDP